MTYLLWGIAALCLLAVILFFSWEWFLLQYVRHLAEPNAPVIPDDISVEKDIIYVHTPQGALAMDIYRPKELPQHPLPVVLTLFGGGWFVGNKNQPVSAPMSVHLLARSGYAVAVINYRLSDAANFPAQLQDARAAVRWLKENANSYHLDAEHIGAWGFSAGGHLSAMLATTAEITDFDQDSQTTCKINAALNFFGPSNLQSWANSSKRTHLASSRWMIERFIGGPAQEQIDKLARASPVTHVSTNSAPMLIIHGEDDTVVPLEQSQQLEKAYQQYGADIELQVIPQAGHGIGEYFGSDEMFQTIIPFFDKHLKQSSIAT